MEAINADFTKQIQNLTVKLEATQQLHEQQTALCVNTKQQLDLANQKIHDLKAQIDRLNKELQEKNARLDQTTQSFNGKDKESVALALEKGDLIKQKDALADERGRLAGQVKELSDARVANELEIQKLQSEVEHLQGEKAKLEADVEKLQATLIDKKKKREKLKEKKKELKLKIKEINAVVKERDGDIEALKKKNEESLEIIKEEKSVINEQTNQIASLKDKLREAMETLQKNSETIEYLNRSLQEAQKFSFRALLSNKQQAAQPGNTATNFNPGNTLTRFDDTHDLRESGNGLRSRSRSPLHFGGNHSNSPTRVIERQRYNGGMLLNSNSFSNAKRQGGNYNPVHPTYTPTLRESQPGTASHTVDYTQPCECREYQANLKVTNKYAERFGLHEETQATRGRNHYTSFGNNPYGDKGYEPAKKEEKSNHHKETRSQKSYNDEPIRTDYYADQASNRYAHNE